MRPAVKLMDTLLEDITRPFGIQDIVDKLQGTTCEKLSWLVKNQLESAMRNIADEVLASRSISTHTSSATLFALLDRGRSSNSSEHCPVCHPTEYDTLLKGLEEVDDPGGVLLVRRARLSRHYARCSETTSSLARWELNQYEAWSSLFQEEVTAALKCSSLRAGHLCGTIGLFHPEGSGLSDPLGRTSWHLKLDRVLSPNPSTQALEELMQCPHNLINKQDILGRSPLHIACMKGWDAAVTDLIDAGANADATTLFGSLPLHFAAMSGTIHICQTLLNSKSMGKSTPDCQGYTPYNYAMERNNTEIVKLLSTQPWNTRTQLSNQTYGISTTDILAEEACLVLEPFANIPLSETDIRIVSDGTYRCFDQYCDFTFSVYELLLQHHHLHMVGMVEYFCPFSNCSRTRKPPYISMNRGFGNERHKLEEHIQTMHGPYRKRTRYIVERTSQEQADNRECDVALDEERRAGIGPHGFDLRASP
jgi:hypothetical protein